MSTMRILALHHSHRKGVVACIRQTQHQETLHTCYITNLLRSVPWWLLHQNSSAAHLQKPSSVPGKLRVLMGEMHQSRSASLFSLISQHQCSPPLRSLQPPDPQPSCLPHLAEANLSSHCSILSP